MRYLTSALLSEGVTDEQFLAPLLSRVLESICRSNFDQAVEVAPVQLLRDKTGPRPIAEMLGLVDQNKASFVIVFFHHDQGATVERVLAEWLTPLRAAWGARAERLITVVPVRETEAWLLADGDAIRRALGVPWPDAEMDLPPTPKLVETVADPKRLLNRVMGRVSRSTTDHFAQFGELVSLDRLAAVPAYAKFHADTVDALVDLGFR